MPARAAGTEEIKPRPIAPAPGPQPLKQPDVVLSACHFHHGPDGIGQNGFGHRTT